jgi:hypothetical protein
MSTNWKQLKSSPSYGGYLKVALCNAPRKPRTRHVHALILETFVGPKPSNKECRHLDGDNTNNALSNLCWGTPQENHADAVRHGTFSTPFCIKITDEDVRLIRQLVRWLYHREIAMLFDISRGYVCHLIAGKYRP